MTLGLYPQPQQINLKQDRFTPKHPYKLEGMNDVDTNVVALLKQVVSVTTAANISLPFVITSVDKTNTSLQRSGAYQLNITPNKISVAAFDKRSVFYAVQTLHQLAHRINGATSLPVGTITDYPDVAFRGTVEGFYGQPWSFADRIEQLRFYGKLKLNTYIYGPKDDPYHSSPHWRDAYPAEKAAQIKELVNEAKTNKVDFVWAIHPGQDIKWNLQDSNAVINKLEKMYDLGVRSFAVFFDDISGAGTDARKQAGLLNHIQRNFINLKKDITPLIMCPTEYNKSWANKKEGTYLDILGEELDDQIRIMWTGNAVVTDITKEGLQWVNNRIKRPAFVWWNFPVSDYVRDHLLMGKAYGLDTSAASDMIGFVLNPMDKSEASKPAIFGVACYTWNMKSYDAETAWQASLQLIMPEAPKAFLTFTKHNSDPGNNGHRYRRAESEEIKPVIDSFLNVYKTGKFDKTLAQQIETEFKKIAAAPTEIRKRSKNARLVEQILPWLQQFELLGNAGVAAMQMTHALDTKMNAKAWNGYLHLQTSLDMMNAIDRAMNKNPYQPGVKTGSLILMPFVNELFTMAGSSFVNASSYSNNGVANANSATALFTNADKFSYQPIQQANNYIAISPLLEVATLKKDEYIGLKCSENLQPATFQFNLESNSLLSWGVFEVSADGKQWDSISVTEKKGKGSFAAFDKGVHYLRFRNFSDKQQSFYLKEFRLEVKPSATGDAAFYTYDRSITTYQDFSGKEPLIVKFPSEKIKSGLNFLLSANSAPYSIISIDKNGSKTILHQGNEDFVQVTSSKTKDVTAIHFTTNSPNTIRVFEIVPANENK